MALTYKIDKSAGLITLTASGQLTADDVTGYLAASRADTAYRADMHRLLVVERIEGFPPLPEVQKITARTEAEPHKPRARIAAVADSPLGLGMISMFLGHWGLSDQYQLFDDVASARTWLVSDEQTRY